MNITDVFPMRKRKSIDKTPGRRQEATVRSSALRRTPRRLTGSNFNNSLLDQSLDIVWDNNSPSPTRTLSLGKRKKKHESDSSSSGGEISALVQKLDKSGNTPEANPPLLAFWMSRENNVPVQNNKEDVTMNNNSSKQKSRDQLQTPSRRPRRVLRKCNKSKMKLLKQDIEQLLVHPIEEEAVRKEIVPKTSEQPESAKNMEDSSTGVKLKGTDTSDFFDDWETDEDDLILSQVVEIPTFKNNIPETQVMTNTQFLGSEEQDTTTQNPLHSKAADKTAANVDTNDSIVTETWDFVNEFGDSDDENVLQNALEDFEKSQQVTIPTVRRVSHLHIKPDMSHITHVQKKEFQQSVQTKSKVDCSTKQRETIADEKCTRKSNFSFASRSTLQSSAAARSEKHTGLKVEQCNLKNSNSVTLSHTGSQRKEEQTSFQNKGIITRQPGSTGQRSTQVSKTVKYTKEDIERKKIEAQNRRKQKMAQSQHKY